MMEAIDKFMFALKSIGLRAILRTIWGTLRRDWYDRGLRAPSVGARSYSPGQLLQSHPMQNGQQFVFEQAQLSVEFLLPDLARLTWSPGKEPFPYAIARTDWLPVQFEMIQSGTGCVLETTELLVQIAADGEVAFLTKAGALLRRDLPPVFVGDGFTQLSRLHVDERIHGLGERAAALNLRPGSYRMQNIESEGSYSLGKDPLYMCIPVYLGRHAQADYLVFYENSHYADFEFGDGLQVKFEGGQLRYYLIPGPLERAYRRYSELTGRAALPPRWALGYHQSRWGYKSAAEIRAIAAGFKAHALPWSAIHLDIDYMDEYRCFTINRERFPDLLELTAELRDQGVQVVAINDVGIKRDRNFAIYRAGLQAGHFLRLASGKPLHALVWPGWSAFPDFTRPATRSWWADLYPRLLDQGIAGIWHDMNEPATFVSWGQPRLPLSTRYDLEGRGADHREANNLYGLLNNRAGFEGLRRHRPDRRPWIVSRSGWAGLQRYAWHWTGDIKTSWESLRLTIAEVLNLGLSGIAYTGPDIGGFTASPGAELFTRWFQLAAFLPFFRGHAAVGTEQQEPWVYGEPHTGIHRKFLQMRYRLMPYLYQLAWQIAQDGSPWVRPLFWHYPDARALQDVEDQYLLGQDLLVAPVVVAGAEARQVIFPPGRWYSLWDSEQVYHGPGSWHLPAGLADLPVFVRGGAVLPLASDQNLDLQIYLPDLPAGQFSSRLYADAGDGYAEWRIDHFSVTYDAHRILMDWRAEGAYPFPYQALRIRVVGGDYQAIQVNGQPYRLGTEGVLELPPL